MAAAFNNLFRKKWFYVLFIAMLILIIVETSVIILLVVASGLGKQVFPALDLNWYATPGCSTLTAKIVSSTMNDRTVEYSCSGSGAINMKATLSSIIAESFTRYGPGPAVLLVVPTFTLPNGYLRLSLVDRNIGCNSSNQISLRSGENMTLGGGNTWSYDYCSVIAGGTGSISGFTISWSEIPWPGDFVKVSASPSQLVVHTGQNASTAITVTSPGMFSGNVTFTLGFEDYSRLITVPLSASISSYTVFLRRGSSNVTTATVVSLPGSVPHTLTFTIYVYPGSGTAPGYGYYPGLHENRAYVNIPVEII